MLHAINAAGHRQSQGLLRPSKQRLILIAAGFVILAETTIVFMTVRVAYWWADDFINFDLAREMGLTWKYLSRSLFGHFAPLYQLTYYVLLQTRPFDHGAVAIIETFLYLTSNVLLFRLLQLLFGQRWLNVVLTGLFGASILHLTSLLWWASGLLIFTTVPLSLICLGGFLKYQATGAKKHLVASVAAFTAGLGFYEPIMVVLGELVLVAALYFSPTASPLTSYGPLPNGGVFGFATSCQSPPICRTGQSILRDLLAHVRRLGRLSCATLGLHGPKVSCPQLSDSITPRASLPQVR